MKPTVPSKFTNVPSKYAYISVFRKFRQIDQLLQKVFF